MWAFYGVLMIPAYYNQATHTPMSAGVIFKRLALPTRAERLLYPNFYQFHSGMARSWMAGGISVLFPKQLTTEERAEIETVADPALHGTRLRTAPPQIKNVIFILVESYLSLVSDHQARDVYMDMGGQLPTEIPLYIVNGGIRGASSEGEGIPAWDGPCNQIDVYPTILDIMGADSQWRGLGCSLLMDEWKDFTDNKTWTVSENIIYGDYFATIQ